ncbi:MAG TPA: fasciclin domain-containing protein [Caldilineaceae bacterium]|nr:fasciclin domain-containing protein [Caldilineaceae bacterium]
MRKRLLLNPIIAALFVLLAILPASAAQFAPAIFAIDQDVVDGAVAVTRVTSNGPGWVVIHADDGGKPGPVLGQTAVPTGISADVSVEIDLDGLTDTLWAMLHSDEGTVGEYEFPGVDAPVSVNDAIVMHPFAVGDITQSIAGLATSTEGFSVLVQALQAADLVETLRADGPFTVFAPTDEAFAAVPADTLDALLADPAQLTDVLLYHVVPGTVMAADISDGMEVETAQGGTLTFAVDGDTVMVNDATVTTADLSAANGVIHVIDTVLLPPAPEEEVMDATGEEATSEEETATEEAAVTPSVTVSDQESDGTAVSVDSVVAAQDGWMVIHSDDNGAPGPVLGQSAVPAGESTDVMVSLNDPLAESATVWAMLHIDDGEVGVYEFPGPDGPVLVDDQIVMAPFAVTVAAMAETEVMTATEVAGTTAMTETTMAETEVMTATEMTDTAAMTETEMAETDVMTETEMTDSAAMTTTEAMDDGAMMDVTPSVTAIDQGSNGTNVAVLQAVAAQAGWIVIHADNNGAPGAVLGHTSLPAGTTDNIIVTLDEPISGEVPLWAMLHVDEGEAGVYEFPGPDSPVTVDGEVVMQPFTAIVTADATATETPAEEAMPEATPTAEAMEEAPAEEAMVEATPTAEAMEEAAPAEEPMADEAMAAPDTLPQTGLAAGSATAHLPVVFLIMGLLFGAAVLTRRRDH